MGPSPSLLRETWNLPTTRPVDRSAMYKSGHGIGWGPSRAQISQLGGVRRKYTLTSTLAAFDPKQMGFTCCLPRYQSVAFNVNGVVRQAYLERTLRLLSSERSPRGLEIMLMRPVFICLLGLSSLLTRASGQAQDKHKSKWFPSWAICQIIPSTQLPSHRTENEYCPGVRMGRLSYGYSHW